MFEKEANEYRNHNTNYYEYDDFCADDGEAIEEAYQKGATDGYKKANEWYKVSDKLPEMDVLVYLWNNVDDFPVVARRHIPYGAEKWVWDCKWGSGYTVSQLAAKGYLWKEIVSPKEQGL